MANRIAQKTDISSSQSASTVEGVEKMPIGLDCCCAGLATKWRDILEVA